MSRRTASRGKAAPKGAAVAAHQRYRIIIAQTMFTSYEIDAQTEDAAWDIACDRYEREPVDTLAHNVWFGEWEHHQTEEAPL